MNKFTSFLLFVLLSGIVIPNFAQSDGLGDSLYPQLGNGGYDARHYTINLTFTPEENHIAGTTRIDAIAEAELTTFNLDLFGLEVEAVTVNGAPATFERLGSELVISPSEPLDDGADFTVVVAYEGVPEPITEPGAPVSLGWQEWSSGYFAAPSQPSGSMNWYPCNNHPLDKATYTFRINVPQPLTAAANGILSEIIENSDGSRTFVWQMNDPMASYLSIVAIGDFLEVRDDSGAVPIRNYFPADTDAAVVSAYDITQEMMAWLSDLLGPYPFDNYGVVAVPGFPVALETQTLSIFGGDAPEEIVILHELMHQWIGNSVTLADWQDIWLHEGVATYFMHLWQEKTLGKQVHDVYMDTYYQLALSESLTAPGSIAKDDLFGTTTYVRGALVLFALRYKVGDDVFYDIFRIFHQENAYATASIADFIAVAERVSGQDLDELFAIWLYGEVLPD